MLFRFQLTAPLALDDVERVFHAFRPLPGIHGVDASPGASEVIVQFDEHAISLHRLEQAAAGAIAPAGGRSAARAGCCGGCCGR